MTIEVKQHNHDELTVVNVTGDSEAVSEIGMDIHADGETWAIIKWHGKGKPSVWEYMLPDAQSTLLHLLTTQSMGKTAWHIKRIATIARSLDND